jgi:competence protein ComEC
MTRSAPFALLAIAFGFGIWTADEFAPSVAWLAVFALVFALATFAVRSHTARWMLSLALFVALGALRMTISTQQLRAQPTTPFKGKSVALIGVIEDEPDLRMSDVRLRVRPTQINAAPTATPFTNIVLVRADLAQRYRYGDVISVTGTLESPPVLDEFDYRAYLMRKSVLSWLPRPERIEIIAHTSPNALYAWMLDLKDDVRLSIQRILPAPESALLNGILIGDDNELPSYIQQAFRNTGTSHIVAISGYNVSIVIGAVALILGRIVGRRRVAPITVPLIIFYMVFVGGSASVVRASIMAIIALAGAAMWRRGFTLNTLGLSAWLILLGEPNLLFDVGFQLSVAATWGLIVYSMGVNQRVNAWIAAHSTGVMRRALTSIIADVLMVTLFAQIAALPLLVVTFHSWSLVSLLTNMLVLPLQPPIMALGFLAALIGMASPALGIFAALPVYAPLTLTLRVIEWQGAWQSASVPVFALGGLFALIYYALLFLITIMLNQTSDERERLFAFLRLRTTWIMIALAFGAIVGGVWWLQRPDGKLHIVFAGEGAFVQTPSGRQFVFDGGGALLPEMGRRMPLLDRDVDVLLMPALTDRTRGASLPLLQRYRVERLIAADAIQTDTPPTQMQLDWSRAVQSGASSVVTLSLGSQIELEPNVSLLIAPRANGQIGARLIYGSTTFELVGTSDIISGSVRSADVVFANPRSRNVAPIMSAIAPRYVIWTDESGDLPTLSARGVRVLALRDQGVVEFVSDGASVTLRD